MKLAAYKKTLTQSLKIVTEVFLIRDNQVCLGLKKRGFGKGKYVGIGGKVHVSEEIAQGACREVFEETNVIVSTADLREVGIARFYFPHIADESWNQEAHIFIAKQWVGEPIGKTDDQGIVEVEPVWMPQTILPFELMWDDARLWLPQIFLGNQMTHAFLFDETLKVANYILVLS